MLSALPLQRVARLKLPWRTDPGLWHGMYSACHRPRILEVYRGAEERRNGTLSIAQPSNITYLFAHELACSCSRPRPVSDNSVTSMPSSERCTSCPFTFCLGILLPYMYHDCCLWVRDGIDLVNDMLDIMIKQEHDDADYVD